MTTTTLRLPPDLKQRIDKLAKSSGTSVHSLMVDAIAQKAEELELRAALHDEADARLKDLLASGVGIDWHDMRTYLKTRVISKKAKAPRVRPWRK